jgi:glucose 1-dehydrogenase
MEIRLDGEVAIVTGGDSGLGRAVGLELAHSGAAVIISFHSNRDKADEVVDTIERANGRCLAVQGDVSLEPDVERLFKTAVDELGGVDILIANAGIQKDAPIAEMSLEDWRAVLDLNLSCV